MYFPGDCLGARQITFVTQFNCVHGASAITTGYIHVTQPMNGGGYDIDSLPATLPEDFASLNLVGTNAVGATHYHLGCPFMNDHQWGGPGSDFIPVFFPEGFAGALIQSDNEGLFFMIPVNDQGVPMEGRGTSLTVVAPGGHFTKVPAPDRFTF